MKRSILVTACAALMAAAPALAASWHLVKSKSTSGQFSVTAFNATVSHPQSMKVVFTGAVNNGNAVVACSRGFTVSSYGHTYNGPGTHVLPVKPRGADSCQVTISLGVEGGTGRASLYAYR